MNLSPRLPGVPLLVALALLSGCKSKATDAIVVTTVAGNGKAGLQDGTGGPHGTAEFNGPLGVAVGPDGSVIVADTGNNCIRRIDSSGHVTTLAGSMQSGFKDAVGGAARFNAPTGVAVDAKGFVFVADSQNYSIRKIDPAGKVTTVAGNGVMGRIDGRGDTAEFGAPTGIALDDHGNLYVADWHFIRKIDPSGRVTTVNTVADETGLPAFGVAVASTGNIMFCSDDTLFSLGTEGQITHVAANDLTKQDADDSFVASPTAVATDAHGNSYFANGDIREIDASGHATTILGATPGNADGTGGPNGTARMAMPTGIAVQSPNDLYVVDSKNNNVRRIHLAGR